MLIILTGTAIYLNSLKGDFIFDDANIVFRPYIHSLWPIWNFLLLTNRPIGDFSFALNYALHGKEVIGYHVVNIAIHILNALVLFGLIRRTLSLKFFKDRYTNFAADISFSISLLWLVHPLQTESVAYISQRLESLMALFYLLTLYGLLRFATCQSISKKWFRITVLSCALGMATKEVMVTAPIVAILFDRMFLSSSWKELFQSRWRIHLRLLETWGILFLLMALHYAKIDSAGFHLKDITPLKYLLTQFEVIVHYLRLVFWPQPLVLDYAWPVVKDPSSALVFASIIGILFLISAVLFLRKHAVGFLGVSFFLILAPSSSIMPIVDIAFEHRMYLPLAFIVALSVFTVEYLLRRMIPKERVRKNILRTTLGIIVILFSSMTILRNNNYRDNLAVWSDVLAKRPSNARAYYSLALEAKKNDDLSKASQLYQKALALKPDYFEAHLNYGVILNLKNENNKALRHYAEALLIHPQDPVVHFNIANSLAALQRFKEAREYYTKAIRLKPDYDKAYYNFANLCILEKNIEEAIKYFRKAIEYNPSYTDVYLNLGTMLAQQKQFDQAIVYFEEALRLNPSDPIAHNNLGNTLALQGKYSEAAFHFREAVRLKPDYIEARDNLSTALSESADNIP